MFNAKGTRLSKATRSTPAGKKQKPSGLGEHYGQGVGYGGYSVEQDQAKSQTGTADHLKKGGGG